jgi:hypothetical protein
MNNGIIFTLGFLLALAGWYCLSTIASSLPLPNALFNESVINAKLEAVDSRSDRPSVFFAGGSNVLFGLNAGQFQQETGVPTINFGCVARMGPEMVLYLLEPRLRKGDTVVMAWEYGIYAFDRSASVNVTYLNLVFGPMVDFLKDMPAQDRCRLVLALPVSQLYEGLCLRWNPYVREETYQSYWTIDEHGDLLSNVGQELSRKELLKLPVNGLVKPLEVSEDTKKIFQGFVERATHNEITVYATWPNIFGHPDYQDTEQAVRNCEVIRDFWEGLGVKIFGEPEDSFFDAEHIHNTHYHLNLKGVAKRTRQMSLLLKPVLE